MYQYKRSSRVSETIKKELSQIFQKNLKDPLIGLVTVTHVRLSEDLKYAKVYISILGDNADSIRTFKGLDRAKNFIRSELGTRLSLKHVPELNFVYDDSTQNAQNIETLLNKIKHEND